MMAIHNGAASALVLLDLHLGTEMDRPPLTGLYLTDFLQWSTICLFSSQDFSELIKPWQGRSSTSSE